MAAGRDGGRRRALFRPAVALAAVAVVVGAVLAYVGFRATVAPAGVVRGYFAALARSDAAAALGYGDLPAGPHQLLTETVLRAQQQIAPMRDVTVGRTVQHGDRAAVDYSYRLGFARGSQHVTGRVRLQKDGSSWRLVRTALPVQLRLDQAAGRASVAGARVPTAPTLLFPGAVPLRFDTGYLRLSTGTDQLTFGDTGAVELSVEPTRAGRRAIAAALAARLRRCVAVRSADDPTCPVPSARFVPGTVKGALRGSPLRGLRISVADDPRGVLSAAAHASVAARYRELGYDNLAHAGQGMVRLPVRASAFAVPPLRLRGPG